MPVLGEAAEDHRVHQRPHRVDGVGAAGPVAQGRSERDAVDQPCGHDLPLGHELRGDARHAIEPATLGLTDAQGRHDANVIIRAPEDRSVFPVPALVGQVQGNKVPLADPLQQIWDLQDLGGADRIEAAGRLREWLLERP
jgi:hypothetical protein